MADRRAGTADQAVPEEDGEGMKTVIVGLEVEYQAHTGVTKEMLLRAVYNVLKGMNVAHQVQVVNQGVMPDSKMDARAGLMEER